MVQVGKRYQKQNQVTSDVPLSETIYFSILQNTFLRRKKSGSTGQESSYPFFSEKEVQIVGFMMINDHHPSMSTIINWGAASNILTSIRTFAVASHSIAICAQIWRVDGGRGGGYMGDPWILLVLFLCAQIFWLLDLTSSHGALDQQRLSIFPLSQNPTVRCQTFLSSGGMVTAM